MSLELGSGRNKADIRYPGFTRAVEINAATPLPPSHPKPNAGAKTFRATFASRAQAEAVIKPLSGYVMQPGWDMAVSVE